MRHFIAIGSGCWGKGKTPTLARASLRKVAGRGVKINMWFEVDPKAYIDDMGYIISPKGSDQPKRVTLDILST